MTQPTPFSFTDEQDQFRSMVQRFLVEKSPTTEVRRLMATDEGFDPAVWRQLSQELALPAISIAERYGGAGFGAVELGIVMEELGRALLCAPYFSTSVLAANAIANAATDDEKASLLPGIASGETLATLAVTEPNGRWDAGAVETTATPGQDGWVVDGSKSFVVDGHTAQLLVVVARAPGTTGGDGLSFFTVSPDQDGVQRELLDSMDPTRKIARIEFRRASANLLGEPGHGASALSRTLDQARSNSPR